MIYRTLDRLRDPFHNLAVEFVQRLNEANPKISFIILETFRPDEVQFAYYAQGRMALSLVNAKRAIAGLYPIDEKANRSIITNCDGVKKVSNHQLGHAMDLAPLDAQGKVWWTAPYEVWMDIAEIGEGIGLGWGGRFGQKTASVLGWDCPHWELKK